LTLDDWSVSVEAMTDVPILVGGRAMVEGPGRLRLTGSLGAYPGAYVELPDAVVARAHLGWRPSSKLGLHVEAGWGFATLGGALTGAEVILFEDEAEAYVDETFVTYVHTPTAGVGLGWWFGGGPP
jgi:hypothetical protein